jgi:sulfite exporter TauE/SafE
MNGFNKNMLGGLIGALVLNVVHSAAKRFDNQAPEVDKVGEEAMKKTVRFAGFKPPKGNALVAATFGADVASNAMLYTLIGYGGQKNRLLKGALLGTVVGLATLTIPEQAGLDAKPIKKTNRTKLMTVAWYVIGGIAAGMAMKAMEKR